jgi:Ca2+-binding EF-hand superfamily protein
MSTAEAKLLIQDAIKSRLGTGQAELLRAFKFFDRDRSGTIHLKEFQEAMKIYAMLEFSDELAEKLMKEFDEDGNGEIDYQEFTTLVMGSTKDDLTSLNTVASTEHVSTAAGNDMMMLRRKVRTQWKDLLQAFRDVDTDKSGTLDESELRRVLSRFNIDLHESQFKELMEQIDEDRDGEVSYAEFMKFFGKGQAEDRVLHTVVHNVTLKQAQTMLTDKIAEKYGLGPEGPAQIKKTLSYFDTGKTGFVTVDDFKSAMIEFSRLEFEPELMTEMLRPFNSNGKINYGQFVQKGLGDAGSTGFDVGTRKYTRQGSEDKPQSPPMDAPANPAPQADTAGAAKMLQLIAEKVEAKSRNIAVTFRNFDEDKSGSVDYDEFRKGLMHLGVEMTDSDFAKLLAVVDNDKSGCINYQEFVEDLKQVDEQTGGFMGDPQAQKKQARVSIEPAPIVQAAPGRSSRSILQQIADKVEQKSKNIRVVFRNFDEDKSGSVDYQEFRKGLEHIGIILTDVDFQTLLNVVDNDNSGTIDYNEFVEDLKHVDEQTGGFFGAPGAQQAAVAAPTAQPRANNSAAQGPAQAPGRSGASVLQQIAEKVEQKSKNVRVVSTFNQLPHSTASWYKALYRARALMFVCTCVGVSQL